MTPCMLPCKPIYRSLKVPTDRQSCISNSDSSDTKNLGYGQG